MSLRLQFILFLLILPLVWPIKLPGSNCPDVPHSFEDRACTCGGNIIRSVPFTADVPTLLFRAINKTEIETEHYSFDSSPGDFFRIYLDKGVVVFSKSISDNDAETVESNLLRMESRRNRPLCQRPTIEKVRLWCGIPLCLLWSCVESNQTDHEEALLVIEEFYVETNETDVLAFSRRFVSENLFGLINSTKHFEGHNGVPLNQATCPSDLGKEAKNREKILSPLILVLIVTFIFFFFGGCWYISSREESG